MLVLLVILIFLQDWRAMLMPATTVPVTIIGAFAAMAALGFTVNLSTLFAIVLAIGIVVDDAIVVVEGAAHNIERGMTPTMPRSRRWTSCLGPIIGITLVLMSVFLPAAFLPGLTGQMYAQFALVIAATALFSAINARDAQADAVGACGCARRCRRRSATPSIAASTAVYDRLERGYAGLIGRMVEAQRPDGGHRPGHHRGRRLWGLARVPTGFLPIEDQGYLLVAVQLPDGASLEPHPEGAGPGRGDRPQRRRASIRS